MGEEGGWRVRWEERVSKPIQIASPLDDIKIFSLPRNGNKGVPFLDDVRSELLRNGHCIFLGENIFYKSNC